MYQRNQQANEQPNPERLYAKKKKLKICCILLILLIFVFAYANSIYAPKKVILLEDYKQEFDGNNEVGTYAYIYVDTTPFFWIEHEDSGMTYYNDLSNKQSKTIGINRAAFAEIEKNKAENKKTKLYGTVVRLSEDIKTKLDTDNEVALNATTTVPPKTAPAVNPINNVLSVIFRIASVLSIVGLIIVLVLNYKNNKKIKDYKVNTFNV